jgi:hypothetical protein
MGMDPLAKDESYEVTIVLQGPINKLKFRAFRTAIDTFLDACAQIDDGVPSSGGGGRKLQVREGRSGVRKTAP